MNKNDTNALRRVSKAAKNTEKDIRRAEYSAGILGDAVSAAVANRPDSLLEDANAELQKHLQKARSLTADIQNCTTPEKQALASLFSAMGERRKDSVTDYFDNPFLNADKVNSMTQYPSILTFHTMDRSVLLDTLSEPETMPDPDEPLYITEKVDGANSRILFCGDDYFIGSRKELLYAKGDRLYIPTQNIVPITLPDIVDAFRIHSGAWPALPVCGGQGWYSSLIVLYGECYGGKVNSSKEYTRNGETGFRLFDIMAIPLDKHREMTANMSLTDIALWRDQGGQAPYFVDRNTFLSAAANMELPVTPDKGICKIGDIPTKHEDTLEWMRQFASSEAKLDESGIGRSEGIVIRNASRTFIRKLRFEDYEKTLRKKAQGR